MTRPRPSLPWRVLAISSVALMSLTACSQHQDRRTTAPAPASSSASSSSAPSSSASSSSSSASATPSGRSSTAAAASCTSLTGQQAVDKWVNRVPADMYPWDPQYAETEGYDRCSDLSWAVLPIKGPTGSSPYQIMLFHHGEFVQPATRASRGFHPDVTRLSDGSIRVVYHYAKEGETTAGRTGEAVSTFTWDEESHSVKRQGELPRLGGDGTTTKDETLSEAGIADQFPDGDSASTKSSDSQGPTPPSDAPAATSVDSSGVATIVTPSGNIGCDLSEDGSAGCGVLSYLQDRKYKLDDRDYGWWFDLGSGRPSLGAKGDAPYFQSTQAQTLDYGQSVSHGNFVCESESDGLTCWNVSTGHGVTMSRKSYTTF